MSARSRAGAIGRIESEMDAKSAPESARPRLRRFRANRDHFAYCKFAADDHMVFLTVPFDLRRDCRYCRGIPSFGAGHKWVFKVCKYPTKWQEYQNPATWLTLKLSAAPANHSSSNSREGRARKTRQQAASRPRRRSPTARRPGCRSRRQASGPHRAPRPRSASYHPFASERMNTYEQRLASVDALRQALRFSAKSRMKTSRMNA
jgi:hypothetical protein